jgi:hypothetical protein
MKKIKLAMIIVGIFASILLVAFVVGAYTVELHTSLPDVPSLSSANCSSSNRACYFGLYNPNGDSTTNMTKAELINATSGAVISSKICLTPCQMPRVK